jgi:type III pantothenate kinase
MSLLCIAVQNTHTVAGLYVEGRLTSHWRISTDAQRTADEWGLLIDGLIARDRGPASGEVSGLAVCSAVPAVVGELRAMAADRFADAHHVFVGPGVRSGPPMLMDNPREVGTDRVANVVGAVERFGTPCVVVSMGTATTYDVVNAAGQYVGGAIAPGVQVSMEALGERSAQLRQVELVTPRTVIGKNTVEALQAGTVYGFAALVDGVVDRIAREIGAGSETADPAVVMTGPLAPVVLEHCRTVTAHEPWLVLDGLRAIHDRNR